MDKPESNKLFFKKYLLMNKIAHGSFGGVYFGKNIHTEEKVAIKLEERNKQTTFLEQETFILYNLKGPGIPEVKAFGKNKRYNILVQTLLGKTLYDIFDSNKKKFNVKDICNIGIQILERLEFVHSKNYIHRDIKPQNFLIGKEIKDENIIYLIDFGLAKKYRSARGNHVKFSIKSRVTGTPRFSSLNAMRGVEQSRRDDLESLCYIIIYFFNGFLPWQGLKNGSIIQRFNAILDMKKNIKISSLCEDLPTEISELFRYVKKLGFTAEPNYNYMKKLFLSILNKNGLNNDNNFSWVKEINYNNINHKKNRSNVLNKEGKSIRLFRQIKNSLEKKAKKRKDIITNKNILKEKEQKQDDYTLYNLYLDSNIQNYVDDKRDNMNYSVKNKDKKIIHKPLLNIDKTNQINKNINILNNLVIQDNNSNNYKQRKNENNNYLSNIYIDNNNGFKLNNTINQREKLSQNVDNINHFTRNKNMNDSKYNTQNNKINNDIIKNNNIVKLKKIYNINKNNQNNNQINLNNKNYYTKFKTDESKNSIYPSNPNLDKKINEIKKNVETIKIKNNNVLNIRNTTNPNTNLKNNINHKKFTKKPFHLRNILNMNSNMNSNMISNINSNMNFDNTTKKSENINNNNKRKNIIINNLYIKSYYNNVNNQNYSMINNNTQRVQENIYRTNNIIPNSNSCNKHSRYKTLAIRETFKINH